MSRLKFNICTSIFLTLLASSTIAAADQVKTLVIVGDADVPIKKFSVGDVRKLYLGYSVKIDGQEIHPIINRSDPLLYVVFLQKIVFLSSRSYQRRLKERLFRSGKRGIPEIDDKDELQKRIEESRNTISFMWLESMPNKSLDNTRKIWSGRLPQ